MRGGIDSSEIRRALASVFQGPAHGTVVETERVRYFGSSSSR